MTRVTITTTSNAVLGRCRRQRQLIRSTRIRSNKIRVANTNIRIGHVNLIFTFLIFVVVVAVIAVVVLIPSLLNLDDVVVVAGVSASLDDGKEVIDHDSEHEKLSINSTTTTTTTTCSNNNTRPDGVPSFQLNDGHWIPMVGLGVAESDERTYQAVKWALQDGGYRLIDTASHESYGNEDQVGHAIRDVIEMSSSSPTSKSMSSTSKSTNSTTPSIITQRQDVFVTTKLWDDDHGFEETIEAFETSLEQLNVEYIDLYLIHSPFGGHLVETWDALVFLQQQQQKEKKGSVIVKSIGVSNFGIQHLEAIIGRGNNRRPVPAVNQIEIHPLLYQQRKPLLEYCQQHNIQVQAFGSMLYGSLQDWERTEPLLTVRKNHPTKTSAHILLRWAIQHNIAVIPKSTKYHRIVDNNQIFDFVLSDDDMTLLDNWGTTVSDPSQRLMYKEEWNWNPIDDAPVHLGETDWFPNYEGYENYFDDEDEDDDEEDDDDDLQDEL